MDQQVFELILERLSNLDAKVDELIAFKYWIVGIGAGSGGIGGWLVSQFVKIKSGL